MTILSLLTALTVHAQTDYSKFVNPEQLNKKQLIKTNDNNSEEIIYWGDIKNKNGQTIYHVLSVFRLVQAAIVKHGHSNIIFLDKNLKFKRRYGLNLPEELPFKLDNNILYFYYTDTKSKTKIIFQNKIGTELPKALCVSPDNCF